MLISTATPVSFTSDFVATTKLMPTAAVAGTPPRRCAADVINASMVAKLRATIPHAVPLRRNEQPRHSREMDANFWDFEWACVDQETIILFDPRLLADRPVEAKRSAQTANTGLPRLDFSADKFVGPVINVLPCIASAFSHTVSASSLACSATTCARRRSALLKRNSHLSDTTKPP